MDSDKNEIDSAEMLQSATESDLLQYETEPDMLQNEAEADMPQIAAEPSEGVSDSESISSTDRYSKPSTMNTETETEIHSFHIGKIKKVVKKAQKKTMFLTHDPPKKKKNKEITLTFSQKTKSRSGSPKSVSRSVSSRSVPRSVSSKSIHRFKPSRPVHGSISSRSVHRSITSRSTSSGSAPRSERATASSKSTPTQSSRRQSRLSSRSRSSRGFALSGLGSMESSEGSYTSSVSRFSQRGRRSRKNELWRSLDLEPNKIYYLKPLQKLSEEAPATNAAARMKSVASRDYLDPTSVKSSRPPSQRSTIDIGGRPPEEDIQEQRYNFLHTILKGVPDIEELSSSSSVEGIKPSSDETIRKKKVTLKPESFVWEEGTQSLDLELESEPPRNSKSPSQVSEISLCSLSDTDEVIEYHGEEKSSIFDITESMMNIEPRGTKVHIESSSSSSLEIRMASLEAIENFLDHIITQIVKHAEHPDVRMRLFLDKKKLQEQLYVLAKDYQEEMYKNQSLDRLVTEYYARRKVFSFITQPNRSQAISHAISQRRYKFVLEELDHRLEHMHALEATKEELLAKLQKEEQAGQAILDEKNTKFESKVRSILLKDGFDRLKGVVDDLLKKMVRTRNEVSAVRRDLLFMQHRYAMISTLAEKMECLVNGLSVNQYLSNQAHNDTLVIKIQEKDIELRRLSEVVTYNMHAMAHWKNKETMAKNMLNQLKRRLRQRQEAKKQCRDRLHKEVLRHKRLKKEQQSLRKMGCLMHYPALLKDFDASVDFSDNKRKVVNKLWVEYDRLERRCNAVEKDTLSASFLLGTSTSPPRGTRNNSRTVVGF